MSIEECGKIGCSDFETATDICVREAPVIAYGVV
jgi:hypothetical protein